MAETQNKAPEAGKSKSKAVKRLKATAAASAYQKQWFQDLKHRVETENLPFAYINADVPIEILRAMDIPFVVNQWWSAICSAKRMGKKYFGLLREAGYRDDLCTYCATPLAESLDPDDHAVDEEGKPLGPWGGLPKPTVAITRLCCDCQNKIFELFSKNWGAKLYVIDVTQTRTTPSMPLVLASLTNHWAFQGGMCSTSCIGSSRAARQRSGSSSTW